MSDHADEGAGPEQVPAGRGGSTDQHITGSPETGTFLTDQPPNADRKAHGSNAGINATGGNRPGRTGDADQDDPAEE